MLLFPALCTAGLQTTEAMTGLINALKTNFATRFENPSIPTEVMRFVNDPFCVDVVGEFAVNSKGAGCVIERGVFTTGTH